MKIHQDFAKICEFQCKCLTGKIESQERELIIMFDLTTAAVAVVVVGKACTISGYASWRSEQGF